MARRTVWFSGIGKTGVIGGGSEPLRPLFASARRSLSVVGGSVTSRSRYHLIPNPAPIPRISSTATIRINRLLMTCRLFEKLRNKPLRQFGRGVLQSGLGRRLFAQIHRIAGLAGGGQNLPVPLLRLQ